MGRLLDSRSGEETVNTCRSCGSPTEHVLSLGEMPLANHLLAYPGESYKKYPLDLMFCPSCNLGQLKEQVDPALMFDEYVYYSSVNGPTVESARHLVEAGWQHLKEGALVAEIGSNDGYLLDNYRRYGVKVLGIDPARGPANAAALKGIPTVQDYFTLELAKTLPKADVVHAHNVLAHVQDLNDFVSGIGEMLKPDGVCVVEVPAIEDMIENETWDLIYHEHNYYFTLQSLTVLFKRHGLSVERYENIPAHGGSFRLFVQHHAQYPVITLTEGLRLNGMQEKVNHQTRELFYFIRGKRVCGFGAAAKATVMLNYSGIGADSIYMIADSTTAKIGKFIPGTGQRIVSPDEWLAEQPEWTCIFAWNYEEEIRRKYQDKYKGTFFTPYKLPQ